MASPSPYRPEFEAALRLFARASEAMHARGFERPVLVGGAAVELYSGSAITTGDFDLATGRQDAFEEELLRVGFIRPVGPGNFSRGLVHPDLKLGFEVVASAPFGGAFDRTTLALVEDFGDAAAFVVLSVEDLIADRIQPSPLIPSSSRDGHRPRPDRSGAGAVCASPGPRSRLS